MKTDNNDYIDARLGELLKETLPTPQRDPWFTRRVLNRLPDRPSRASRWVTALSVAAALAVLAFYWRDLFVTVASCRVVTIGMLALYTLLGAVTVSVVAAIVWPRLSRVM